MRMEVCLFVISSQWIVVDMLCYPCLYFVGAGCRAKCLKKYWRMHSVRTCVGDVSDSTQCTSQDVVLWTHLGTGWNMI